DVDPGEALAVQLAARDHGVDRDQDQRQRERPHQGIDREDVGIGPVALYLPAEPGGGAEMAKPTADGGVFHHCHRSVSLPSCFERSSMTRHERAAMATKRTPEAASSAISRLTDKNACA